MTKFKVITKMAGEKTADFSDPYGEKGFSSLKWYYGTTIFRPERLAVVKTVARHELAPECWRGMTVRTMEAHYELRDATMQANH